jgi:small-conductance mechanosensitive channel
VNSLAGRLLATALLIAAAAALNLLGGSAVRRFSGTGALRPEGERRRFWMVHGLRLLLLALLIWGALRIWFVGSDRLSTVLGLATAGVAVALQRVITSFAGYLIVLRGRVYTVGDRITLGGVRGDVVSVGFMQTAVLEMGEPANAQTDGPRSWITGRQYTGRIVSVTNDRIFETPVYNYTREFPYLWDEIVVPVKYGADRRAAERILLDVARRHTGPIVLEATPALARLAHRYLVPDAVALEPQVYLRLTDNWVELTVRFVGRVREIRGLKDAMSREIIDAFEQAGLEVASATYEIVGLPRVTLVSEQRDPTS